MVERFVSCKHEQRKGEPYLPCFCRIISTSRKRRKTRNVSAQSAWYDYRCNYSVLRHRCDEINTEHPADIQGSGVPLSGPGSIHFVRGIARSFRSPGRTGREEVLTLERQPHPVFPRERESGNGFIRPPCREWEGEAGIKSIGIGLASACRGGWTAHTIILLTFARLFFCFLCTDSFCLYID